MDLPLNSKSPDVITELSRREIVQSLFNWMLINGHSKSSCRIIKNIFAKSLGHLAPDDKLKPASLLRNEAFLASVNMEAERVIYAQRLLDVLGMMDEDSSEMSVEGEVFSFTEINPGLGALGLASINLGGFPHGSSLVSPIAVPTFRENRGSDSTLEPYLPVDLTLVNLPFSAFVGIGQPDPSVIKIIEAAAESHQHTKCTLFRVDWTIGQRLGLDPSAYCTTISRHFIGQEVQSMVIDTEWFVPMEGFELFIAVALKFSSDIRPFGDSFVRRLASSIVDRKAIGASLSDDLVGRARRFPRQNADRIDCDYWNDPTAAVVKNDAGFRRLTVCEVMRLLGIDPEFKIPSDAATAYHLLGESVVVPVAEWVIRGVLRALR